MKNLSQLREIAKTHGTPVWVYDAAVIAAQVKNLRAFDVIRYAQKANSNLHILRLMKSLAVSVDAVSKGELERALAAGYTVDDLVLTTDLLDRATLDYVCAHHITVNAGSIDMLRQIGELSAKTNSAAHKVWIRVNPGFGHGHSPKANTGGENSKHGIWHTQIADAMKVIAEYGLNLVGVHMHIGSGVDYGHLQRVGQAMVDIIDRYGLDIQAISAGGGLSTPYKNQDQIIDVDHYFSVWQDARAKIEQRLGHAVKLEIEPGRYLVAQSGVLLTEVRAVKTAGEGDRQVRYVLIDAGFNELVRPAMYGSYHEISAFNAEFEPIKSHPLMPTVIAGPLCESGDVFTQAEGGILIPRSLPTVHVGDYIMIHDTGAYGAAMSSLYNSRPLCPEVLIDQDGQTKLIRRAQKIEELLILEEEV